MMFVETDKEDLPAVLATVTTTAGPGVSAFFDALSLFLVRHPFMEQT
jgi:hypothetical protein